MRSSLAPLLILPLLLAACGPESEALWPNGIVRFQGDGRVGQEQGEWSYRYRDGQLREHGRFREGRRVGRWEQWFPNGQRANVGERAWVEERGASERQGAWRFWHENGVLRAEGNYVDGQRVGSWTFHKADGSLEEALTGTYQEGKKIGPSAPPDGGR